MKLTLDILKEMRPEEFVMRERLREQQKTGNNAGLPWWQSDSGQLLKKGDDNGGDYHFVISSSRVDRMLDIVRPDGMDNKQFRKNPVVLWGHDDHILPIGRSLREVVIPKKRVEADMRFDTENDPTGLAAAIEGKVRSGDLSATSIRFRPYEYELIYEEVENEATGAKTEMWTGGFDFKEWELLEWSVVPIPANPDCVRRAYGVLTEGVKSDDDEVMRAALDKLVDAKMEPFLAQLAELKTLVEKFEADASAVSTIRSDMELERAADILRELVGDVQKSRVPV